MIEAAELERLRANVRILQRDNRLLREELEATVTENRRLYLQTHPESAGLGRLLNPGPLQDSDAEKIGVAKRRWRR